MGTPLIGRNVRIEVGKTAGAAKPVTAVTKAKPGVASSAAHGLLNGSVGYFNIAAGMSQLDGQAVRIANQATGTFELEGFDTTNFSTWGSGEIVPVTAWSTLSRAASYSTGGGAADKLDNTTLLDDQKQEVNGLLAAESVDIDLKLETTDEEALELVRVAARANDYLVFRFTFKDGAQRVFRGQPSLPGESVGQGAIGTGKFSVSVKGQICRLAP